MYLGGVPSASGYVFDISTEATNIVSTSPLKVVVNQPTGTVINTVISDENGCETTLGVTVPMDNYLMLTMSSTPGCLGGSGSATAMPRGGTMSYTYAWSNGGTTSTISNIAPGNYTVTVTDANGCQIIDNVTVSTGSCDFDVALKKVLLTPAPIKGGDDVTFEITVYNQGLIDATDVIVHDYIPTGLTLNDPTWTTVSPNVAADTIANLAAGDSAVLTITLRIYSSFTGTLINNAEIVDAGGGTDSDSPLSNTNDGSTNELSTDDELNDEAPGTPGSADNPADEDDYDDALINVDCSKQICRPHQIQVEFND